MAQFKNEFLSSDHKNTSVNEMLVNFKTQFSALVHKFIPSKMTKTKYLLSWIDASIRKLLNRKGKLHLRARKLGSPDVKNHYKKFRVHVQTVIVDASWRCVSNIFTTTDNEPDPTSPGTNKAKEFWSFVKSLKTRLGSTHSAKRVFG